MTTRVLFHVQHLLGIGHLKRAAILASAMAAEGLDVTVAYGGIPFPDIRFKGVRVVELPAATIADENFSALLDAAGTPVDDAWRDRRRDALLDLFRKTDPHVILIEMFPFGRRQFAFELLPLLAAAHGAVRRARIASSVRDVLVGSRHADRDEATIAALRRFFDAVLVHGDPDLIPLQATFAAADRIADLIRYTGYVVASPSDEATSEGTDEVVVSAGGGAVGASLLDAAVAARPQTSLADRVWRLLTGPNLPEKDFARLSAQADDKLIVERFRPDFAARLRNATLSISQAGYNTTMDILASGVRAVVVPYETRGETEQRRRADILAERGLLTVLPAASLSAQRLTVAVAEALASRHVASHIDHAGAMTSARIVRELAMR